MKPEVTILSILTSGDRLRRFLGQIRARSSSRWRSGAGPWPSSHGPSSPERRASSTKRSLGEIADRRKVAAGRTDIMSLLIGAVDEEGEGLSDGELRDEMMTLLVAGHETTAITLAWAIGLCVGHPEVMAEMRLEYDQVFGRARDGGEGAGFDPARIQELKYTDAVVRETLRLYPVASAVVRRLKQPMTIAGYALPEGSWFPLARTTCIAIARNLARTRCASILRASSIEDPSRASGSPSAGGAHVPRDGLLALRDEGHLGDALRRTDLRAVRRSAFAGPARHSARSALVPSRFGSTLSAPNERAPSAERHGMG